MKWIKRLVSGVLTLVIISVVFIGSCGGMGVLWMQSPRWVLDNIDSAEVGSIYVAFMKDDSNLNPKLYVTNHTLPIKETNYEVQYHMPEERMSLSFGKGEGSASVVTKNESDGSQLIQVFMVGDTPWTSLSEYRVVDNKVYPLRHAHSSLWFLLAVIVIPWLLVSFLLKPISRLIKRIIN